MMYFSAVLTNDGGDSAGGCGSAGVDHDQKLHEAVVDVARLARLQDEDILVADALANGDTVKTSVQKCSQTQAAHLGREIVR